MIREVMLKGFVRILVLAFLFLVTPNSCIMDFVDTKTAFYVKNCTDDTLFVDIEMHETLKDDIYWGVPLGDAAKSATGYIATMHKHRNKVIISNSYLVLPDSISKGTGLPDFDTFYVYVLKQQVAEHHSLKEICARKLYDRRAVTKKDFHNRIYEYRPLRNAKY